MEMQASNMNVWPAGAWIDFKMPLICCIQFTSPIRSEEKLKFELIYEQTEGL